MKGKQYQHCKNEIGTERLVQILHLLSVLCTFTRVCIYACNIARTSNVNKSANVIYNYMISELFSYVLVYHLLYHFFTFTVESLKTEFVWKFVKNTMFEHDLPPLVQFGIHSLYISSFVPNVSLYFFYKQKDVGHFPQDSGRNKGCLKSRKFYWRFWKSNIVL